MDSEVLDNDEALLREGVRPTYRKVKGFEPLQLSWNRQFVNAQFRSGSRHSNHDKYALEMLRQAVEFIWKRCRKCARCCGSLLSGSRHGSNPNSPQPDDLTAWPCQSRMTHASR